MRKHMASGLVALSAVLVCQAQRSTDVKEDVRTAYTSFIGHLNALSDCVTPQMWTPEIAARLQGFNKDDGSKRGLAKMSIEDVNVIVADLFLGVVQASRTLQWEPEPRKEPDVIHDSVVAVLLPSFNGPWRVAYQLAVSADSKFNVETSPREPGFVSVQVVLETILKGISSGDERAVKDELTHNAGQTLTGEVGWFLHDPHKKTARWTELNPIARSSDTYIVIAAIRSKDLQPDPKLGGVGVLTISKAILVFRRSHEDAWKLDAEILCGL